MKKKYFSTYQSVIHSEFESIEKDKEYEKYLKRIERIVHKKPYQDTSPLQYMKTQRLHKQTANKLAKQELEEQINNANQILIDRIITQKKRKPQKHLLYELKCDLPRRKELQRIDIQNLGIAERLAKRYAHQKKNPCLGGGSITHKVDKPLKKRSPENRKLPELMSLASSHSLHKL